MKVAFKDGQGNVYWEQVEEVPPSDKCQEERQLIHDVMKYLDLPKRQFFLNGSSVLAMHGIDRERPMGDIDIFATTALWFSLMERLAPVCTMKISSVTLREQSGTWFLMIPESSDAKRCFDPPIMRSFIYGITVDIFLNWRRRNDHADFDCAFYLRNVQMVGGLPCTPLQFIMDWKMGQGRNKDLMDVVAIRQFLGNDARIND